MIIINPSATLIKSKSDDGEDDDIHINRKGTTYLETHDLQIQ